MDMKNNTYQLSKREINEIAKCIILNVALPERLNNRIVTVNDPNYDIRVAAAKKRISK
jgi:hypothetical protein